MIGFVSPSETANRTVQGGVSRQKVEITKRIGIIKVMKNKFKYLYYQASFDHLVLLLLSISLIIGLVSVGQVQIVSMGVFVVLIIVLCVHLVVEGPWDRQKSSSECLRGPETMSILVELANRMNVRLHPTKSLKIVPGLRNAKATPCPFLSGFRVHFGGTVQICCTMLCGLEGPALGGVLAHELAHLKRRHLAKVLLSLLAFIPILVYGLVSRSVAGIPILLSFAIFGLVISLISWQTEYEADAVAAEYVGKERMAYALEQVAQLLHRHRDTFTHPSFKRRISRLLSEKE